MAIQIDLSHIYFGTHVAHRTAYCWGKKRLLESGDNEPENAVKDGPPFEGPMKFIGLQ